MELKPINSNNYREHPAINYSRLKTLAEHPSKLTEERKETPAMIDGDIIDLLAFDKEGFDQKYYVSSLSEENFPSDTIRDIVDWIIEGYGADGFIKENILQACKVYDYGQSWKEDTRVRKVTEQGGQYAGMLDSAGDRTIISTDEHMEWSYLVSQLQSHQWTRKYFGTDPLPSHQELLFQVPVQARSMWNSDVWYKGLLDILFIDHDLKTIQPIDLKSTGGFAESFPYQFISMKYYLQASLYWYILKWIARLPEGDITPEGENEEVIESVFPADFDPRGYEVKNFKFIVSSKQSPDHPVIYRTTQMDLRAGLYGGVTDRHKKLKGVIELTDDYLWHTSQGLYDYSREVYEKGGSPELGIISPGNTVNIDGKEYIIGADGDATEIEAALYPATEAVGRELGESSEG